MNVGEWFLWPELGQSSPIRKAKPSYKSPVSSINCCSIFRGWSPEHWSKKTTRDGAPKGLVAGHSWSRCYSANSTGVSNKQSAASWAADRGVSLVAPVNPFKGVPYYLTIVGSLDRIPYE